MLKASVNLAYNPAAVAISGGTVAGVAISGSTVAGVTTNSNAAAGIVGEFVAATIAAANAVPLTDTTAADVTHVSLTAGDWDVSGQVDFTLTGATSTLYKAALSLTSATLPTQAGGGSLGTDPLAVMPLATTALSATFSQAIAPVRVSLAAPAIVYLVAQAAFSVGANAAYGTVRARRVR